MDNELDTVESAANDSFPASDPPSWTPVTGTGSRHRPATVHLGQGGSLEIHVAGHRGEELREHLASHAISTQLARPNEGTVDCLEVEGDVDSGVLQALVDEWEQ